VPAVLVLFAFPTTIQVRAAPGPQSGSAGAVANPYACPFTTTEFSTARNVNLAAPKFALAAGDSIRSSYEFEVTTTTLTALNLHLTVPSFFATYPLTSGPALSSYLSPRTLTITTALSWTSASQATATKTVTAATTFSGSSATMSTQFLAIMANASYLTVTLAFRWNWTVTFASNGTQANSPWSTVTIGGSHPTTFFPAPAVQLVSTSNKTVTIGNTFSTYLSGAVSDTEFHSVLEYASTGNVMRNTPTQTPVGNTTPQVVAVTILPATGPLSPNSLLDHVRDVCSALLFSISVKAVYATNSNVTMQIFPSTCGPITFDGKSYTTLSKAVVTPSSTALAISAGACAGHVFSGWNATAGVSVTSGTSATTSATISASGSLTARYA
jgi:hypothetical protein